VSLRYAEDSSRGKSLATSQQGQGAAANQTGIRNINSEKGESQ
jgi:hypothetical protein